MRDAAGWAVCASVAPRRTVGHRPPFGGQGGVDGVPQPAESPPPRAGAEKSAILLEAHGTENEYFLAFSFLFAVHHRLGPVPGIDCFRKWLSFARYARPMPWRSGAVRGQPHAGPRSTPPPPPPAPVTSESAGVRRHSTRSRTAALAAPGPMRRERPRVGYVSVRFRVEHDAGSLGTAWAEVGIVRGGGGGGWPCGGASAWVWGLMLAGPRPGAPTSRGVQRPKAAPGLPHAWPLHMGGRPCGALPRDLGRPGNRSSDPSGAVRLLRGLGEREMGGRGGRGCLETGLQEGDCGSGVGGALSGDLCPGGGGRLWSYAPPSCAGGAGQGSFSEKGGGSTPPHLPPPPAVLSLQRRRRRRRKVLA